MRYTESYYNLSHGTDIESAEDIKTNGFALRGDKTSWCGEGVYFYDIKAKAWWAAKRKCNELKQKGKGSIKATVILADIEDIYKDETFDLRVKKDLDDFESFVNLILSENDKILIEGVDDEVERKIVLRSLLISFYAKEKHCKLVIGNFKQRPQPLYEHTIEFADSLDMVFGVETIYCVKDTGIISNIRIGGKQGE